MKNIYKIIFLLILNSEFSIHNSFSQTAPGIEWQNTIGGSGWDRLNSIQKTFDGGYILGGYSASNISGDKTENSNGDWDYWIIKTDVSGNIQWQNTIGGSSADYLYNVQQTADTGYILGGYSSSNISGDKTENSNGLYDYWIVKTDATGNIQWQNTIGGAEEDQLYSIKQTYDGGYILGGYSKSNISGDKTDNVVGGNTIWGDYWVIKLNSIGNIEWQNTIGGSNIDFLKSVLQTSDGGYMLGGESLSVISGDKTEYSNLFGDYWILKIDGLGNIQWQNTIGGNDIETFEDIELTIDGNYIIGGSSKSNISGDKTENCLGGASDYWIVKIDTSGNILWQNTIGGNNNDYVTSIQACNDMGYIIGGFSFSDISGDKTENNIGPFSYDDYWIVKIDSIGNLEWQNTIGGIEADYLYDVKISFDQGYILAGSSRSEIGFDKTENSLGNFDYWIIKLFPDTITGISDFGFRNSELKVFPNPLTSVSTITFQNPQKEKFLFTLYDITGRPCEVSPLSLPRFIGERSQGCVVTTDNKIILEKGNKQAGVYLFNLTNEKTGERMNGKIIVQ